MSAIWDDENMPVDEYGIRADLIMTPASVINRMNPSQLYEQFWNRVAVQVVRNCKDRWLGGYVNDEKRDWIEDVAFRENWRAMFAYIIDFLNDFRPAYAKFIAEETVITDNDRKKFVEACLNDGIYLIAGFTAPVDPNHILEVAAKHGVDESHISYRTKDPETGEFKTITTINKAMIGSKYVMLLGKIPSDTISAVEIGYVSQFELPIKLKSKHMKSQSVVALTPMKFGEDETCILAMSIGAERVARTYAIHASAPEVVKDMARTLITSYYPTQLLGLEMHTQDIIDRNQNVSMLAHMAAVCGYDITKHEAK